MLFDLKGSSQGRYVKSEGKDQLWWEKPGMKSSKIMKDNNFL